MHFLKALWKQGDKIPATVPTLPVGLIRIESGPALLEGDTRKALLAGITGVLTWPPSDVEERIRPVFTRFAERVQQLPASSKGLALDKGLQAVLAVLNAHRENPLETPTADNTEWPFLHALITATLLRVSGEVITRHAVMLYDSNGCSLGTWNPLTGSMYAVERAVYYRTIALQRQPLPGLNTWLAQDLLPAAELFRLFKEKTLSQDWLIAINDSSADNPITRLIRVAEQRSVGNSPQTAVTADSILQNHTDTNPTSLREILLVCLRTLFTPDETALLNSQDSWGWRVGDHLYLVGKYMAEQLRRQPELHPYASLLERNATLYQVLAERHITVSAPDKPIFNIQVTDETWTIEVAALKIPLSLLWENAAVWPVPFAGTVIEKNRHPDGNQP